MKEFSCLAFGIKRRVANTQTRDDFSTAIGPKSPLCKSSFFFGGKANRVSLTHNFALFQPPINLLFQVLERKGTLEPWIKHAVGEKKIRRARGPKVLPRRYARPLPQSVRNTMHRVLDWFLGVIRYQRFHTQTFQALVQTKHRLDYPAGPQVHGVGQVNDFRQGNVP